MAAGSCIDGQTECLEGQEWEKLWFVEEEGILFWYRKVGRSYRAINVIVLEGRLIQGDLH